VTLFRIEFGKKIIFGFGRFLNLRPHLEKNSNLFEGGQFQKLQLLQTLMHKFNEKKLGARKRMFLWIKIVKFQKLAILS
jgi:hypothetical protein